MPPFAYVNQLNAAVAADPVLAAKRNSQSVRDVRDRLTLREDRLARLLETSPMELQRQSLSLASLQGLLYEDGHGVPKDLLQAYMWYNIATSGSPAALKLRDLVAADLTPEQEAEGQKMAREFKPRQMPSTKGDISSTGIAQTRPESSGTGFFITEDGYLITNF